MATSCDVLCGVCDARHITINAVYWCPECEEGLCSECQVHHSLLKVTRTHGMITIEQYKALPSSISKIVQHCKDHGLKYTNYCPHNDQMCCPNCISSTHADCKGFMSVHEIIKTAKTSTLLDSMEQSLNDIENNIEKVIQNREINLSNIRQQRQKFHDNLKQLRKKINSHLDTMEQYLISEVNKAEEKVHTKIDETINRLSVERESVKSLKINIKTIKEHSSDLQTFLGSKTYQLEVEKTEKYMKSLSEDGSLNELNLDCSINNKILEMLQAFTFGSVSIETGSPSLVLKTEQDKQAQIMTAISQPSPKSINDIKLSLLRTYDIPKPGSLGYRGCIVHPNGKLILTDWSKSKLIVLNNDGKVDRELPCSSYVNDVTSIDDRTVAVSTDNGIDIINIDTKNTRNVIKTSKECYGITRHKGTLLWCQMEKGIQRMDLSDESITTLIKQDTLPSESFITLHGDKLLQSNRHTQTVTCYSCDGERLWEYKNASVLQNPMGVAVDSNDNIYVTSYNSSDVVMISADGKEGRILLNETVGLYRPFGIFYQKNELLIVNRDGPAFLYHAS